MHSNLRSQGAGKVKRYIKDDVYRFFKSNGIIAAFLLIMLLFGVTSDVFFTVENISLVLRQVAVIGVIALAITFVMIGGNFDLSIGSTLSLSAIVVLDLHDKIGPLPAILAGLLLGMIIGGINGLLVGGFNLNSIIVTLGMLMMIQGATLLYSGGASKFIAEPESTWFPVIGRGSILGISIPIIIFFILTVVFWLVHTKTIYGRYLNAAGISKTVSVYTGVRYRSVIFSTYVLSGLAAAIGGIMLSSRSLIAKNTMGSGYELDVLAAVILGGTSLLGGSGSILKVVVAVLILGFVQNGLILLGFSYYFQWIVTWAIILMAVTIEVLSKKRRSSMA